MGKPRSMLTLGVLFISVKTCHFNVYPRSAMSPSPDVTHRLSQYPTQSMFHAYSKASILVHYIYLAVTLGLIMTITMICIDFQSFRIVGIDLLPQANHQRVGLSIAWCSIMVVCMYLVVVMVIGFSMTFTFSIH
jgi:hypothetical protein